MAGTFKDTLENTGHKLAEAATRAEDTVKEKLEEAADWAKEKTHQAGDAVKEFSEKASNRSNEVFGETGPAGSKADIREHMDVIGSCGSLLGKVDLSLGNSIKLTRQDSPDGVHHLIPMAWVSRVDQHVHLSKSCDEARKEWQTV